VPQTPISISPRQVDFAFLYFHTFCLLSHLLLGPALGMVLASAYAISGLAQAEFCFSPPMVHSSAKIPSGFFLSWSVLPWIPFTLPGLVGSI